MSVHRGLAVTSPASHVYISNRDSDAECTHSWLMPQPALRALSANLAVALEPRWHPKVDAASGIPRLTLHGASDQLLAHISRYNPPHPLPPMPASLGVEAFEFGRMWMSPVVVQNALPALGQTIHTATQLVKVVRALHDMGFYRGGEVATLRSLLFAHVAAARWHSQPVAPDLIAHWCNTLHLDTTKPITMRRLDSRACVLAWEWESTGNLPGDVPVTVAQQREARRTVARSFLAVHDGHARQLHWGDQPIGDLTGRMATLFASISRVLVVVNMHNCGLSAWPLGESASAWPHLRQLVLSSNTLTQMPAMVGELKRLEVLDVSSNRDLTSLPPLGGLGTLADLNVANTGITRVPHAWAFLPALARLNISWAPIRHCIPRALIQGPSFRSLMMSGEQGRIMPYPITRAEEKRWITWVPPRGSVSP